MQKFSALSRADSPLNGKGIILPSSCQINSGDINAVARPVKGRLKGFQIKRLSVYVDRNVFKGNALNMHGQRSLKVRLKCRCSIFFRF